MLYHITEIISWLGVLGWKSQQYLIIQSDIIRPPSNKTFCCKKSLAEKLVQNNHGLVTYQEVGMSRTIYMFQIQQVQRQMEWLSRLLQKML